MLDTRVLSLGVFPNQHGINVVIRSLKALDRNTRTNIREQVERPTESQVQRDVTLSNLRTLSIHVNHSENGAHLELPTVLRIGFNVLLLFSDNQTHLSEQQCSSLQNGWQRPE